MYVHYIVSSFVHEHILHAKASMFSSDSRSDALSSNVFAFSAPGCAALAFPSAGCSALALEDTLLAAAMMRIATERLGRFKQIEVSAIA